ncbi:MAG: hypothetical protein DME64_14270 [Verrucomicrobia bacterium]|nr:MAG: hypothetical protein DME64_14270 [Verrucomicrobiota bacterium]
MVVGGVTRDVGRQCVSGPARGCPIDATITCPKQAAGAEAEPRRKIECLRIAGRRAQPRRTQERSWQAGPRWRPRQAAISGAEQTALITATGVIVRRDHNLIEPVLDDIDVGHRLKVANLVDLGPSLAGVTGAPDSAFKPSYSEVGTAKQNQVRVVDAKTHCVEIRFIQRTLVRTKWGPAPVVLAPV